MAETVLYLLNSTDDSTRIAIQPRTYDGVGGVQRNTDLTLYGNGAPNWGERFDENFYHMLEHFAVDEKTSPALPIAPQNETDLATVGLGINNPTEGQIWYNKTRNELFVYASGNWKPSGKVSIVGTTAQITGNLLVPSPRTGELAYSTDTSSLYFYNGSTWVVASPAVPPTRAINTSGSLQGGGDLSADRTLTLVNDSINPGSVYYYGTNGAGTKGFYPFPAGGSVTSVAASGSTGLTVGGSPITTSGTLTLTLNSELQGLAVLGSTGIMRRSGVGSYTTGAISSGEVTTALGFTPVTNSRSVSTTGSLTGGGDLTANRTLQLVNDNVTPGILQYYGTDSGGTKGFYSLANVASLGVSQNWSLPGKNKGITYTNSTGRPILVMVTMNINLGSGTVGAIVNGVTVANTFNGSSGDNQICFSFIVPAGQTYSVFGVGTRSNVQTWAELS